MSINFMDLPERSPNVLPEKGIYYYKIEEAHMKTAKSGTSYLQIKASLTKGGKKYGNIYDNIMDIESDIPRFKLRQLIVALGLPITGAFELADLEKMIVGKKILADIHIAKSKDPKYPDDRCEVDPFSAKIYYPLSDDKDVLKPEEIEKATEGATINASDADDALTEVEDPFNF